MRTLRGFLPLTAALLSAIGCAESPTDPWTHFTARVSGVVRDAVAGHPIAGAEVIRLEVDSDCDIDQNGAIRCQNSISRVTDITDGIGRYQLTYPEKGICRPCEHHESGQCTSTRLVVIHSDYESYAFSPEILCQSDRQTLPDIELVPLSG